MSKSKENPTSKAQPQSWLKKPTVTKISNKFKKRKSLKITPLCSSLNKTKSMKKWKNNTIAPNKNKSWSNKNKNASRSRELYLNSKWQPKNLNFKSKSSSLPVKKYKSNSDFQLAAVSAFEPSPKIIKPANFLILSTAHNVISLRKNTQISILHKFSRTWASLIWRKRASVRFSGTLKWKCWSSKSFELLDLQYSIYVYFSKYFFKNQISKQINHKDSSAYFFPKATKTMSLMSVRKQITISATKTILFWKQAVL